jgi:tRNA A-37 threonylcarbamoyl transferase component Bud32
MVGEVIGNYRILRKIGEGGMGTVYIAEHTLIGRKAAIKVLQREMSYRRELVTRFFNEAKAATAVKHPGIVELYDFGYASDGSAFIVMEYLEGESLTRRLARLGTLAETSAVALCRQIAGGLGAAHAQGIVHRDLKPDNIFIVRDPDIAGGERTKILDFGIAKLPRDAAGDQSVTLDGQIVGTPAYMSPEQCKGARGVDQRADLYALGCILFEMVCGRGPFVGEGAGEVMAQHIYVAVPVPSSIKPVTPQLEQVILRALAKDPAHRFQFAEEMSEALQAAVLSAPVGGIGQPGVGQAPVAVTPVWTAPPPVALPQPTTLSQASGVTVQVGPARRRPWRAIAIAAVVVGGGAVTAGALRAREPGASAVALESSATPAHVSASQATGSQPTTPPPAAAQPTAAQATASQPAGSQPTTPPPAAAQPTAAQATASQPAGAQPTTQPTATQPKTPQPAAAQAAAAQPVASAPATPPPADASREAGTKSPRAATTRQVKIRLASDPPGAEVFRMPQGMRIGSTPLAYTMDATSGKVTLALKRRGYADLVITVPGDRDHDQVVALGKLAARSPSAGEGGAGSAAESPARGSLDPFEKLDPKNDGKRP